MVSSTSLFDAVDNNDLCTINSLIQSGTCDVNVKDSFGTRPLHEATQKCNIEIIRCLTEHAGCDVNVQNILKNTPLHQAVSNTNLQIVKCINRGPGLDVVSMNRADYNPPPSHVGKSMEDICKLLSEQAFCKVNLDDSGGYTPLLIAVWETNRDIIKCLLDRVDCDANVVDHDENSLFSTAYGLLTLHFIARFQDVELVQILIQRNVDVLTNHVDNRLQLVKFILSKNDFQSLWFFIQNGLFINSLTSIGENIIHLLAKFYMDYLYIDFSFVFDYGLDLNLVNNDGNSPLMVASLLNNLPFIQLLASLPCDVNIQNHQGHTALHLCVIGFTLIKEKLNIMKINSVVKELCAFDYYPKYLACINALLNLGADVNIRDIGGKTVLMLACMKNDRKLLETLLIPEADVNIVDSHGRSALQYIDLTNNVYDLTCFNLLLSEGCRLTFNQLCLNGNTIIQNVLKFSPLWHIDDTVNFIKFLVFKNVNLQLLTSDDGEISYGQLSLEEFSSEFRHELRQILFLSGGSIAQITQILHFEAEENYEAALPETLRVKPREKFYLFAHNLSLKEICRRVIRQNTGLAIHDRISELLDFPTLTNFLIFKDIDSERFALPFQLESFIHDDYEDDYDSYDLNKENDDYENDYFVYIDCKYLDEVIAGFERLEKVVLIDNNKKD